MIEPVQPTKPDRPVKPSEPSKTYTYNPHVVLQNSLTIEEILKEMNLDPNNFNPEKLLIEINTDYDCDCNQNIGSCYCQSITTITAFYLEDVVGTRSEQEYQRLLDQFLHESAEYEKKLHAYNDRYQKYLDELNQYYIECEKYKKYQKEQDLEQKKIVLAYLQQEIKEIEKDINEKHLDSHRRPNQTTKTFYP